MADGDASWFYYFTVGSREFTVIKVVGFERLPGCYGPFCPGGWERRECDPLGYRTLAQAKAAAEDAAQDLVEGMAKDIGMRLVEARRKR